ncbi:hypothetical protein HH308_20450 [Gordonia sp. TBRC 11910]|uniref:Uncharacterized protein n=1 Tax=Gordonia asplenii TaxID=2725283 RepID=A0A848KY50_9ACTN|nr:hypothetical protein [Gordonia asplenii]NMO03590.1 hypothetical protein [Gordonia asplenii]
MSDTAVLAGPQVRAPEVTTLHGVERDRIRAAVRGRIDDVVLTAGSRDDAHAAIALVGSEFGRIAHCAVNNLGSVDDLTSDLRAGGVSTVLITGATDVPSIVALTNHVHRYGARVAVDATEIIARQPFSIVSHGIDYVICDAGPLPDTRGGAILIGRADWLTGLDDVKGPRS